MITPHARDAAGPPQAGDRVKHVVSHLAGYTLVAGIGAMAYGAALYCWLSERIAARPP